MIPRRPSLPEHHLAHARAGRGARHRPDVEQPGRGDDAQAARRVGDVAVAVGLHARGAGGDPAAERRVGEGVGEVAEGPALGVELLLEPRAEDAGLHARQPRGLVDLEQPVHPAEVDRDDGPRLLPRRLEAAGDARAAAERDHDGVRLERRAQDLDDRGLVAGPHDDVGHPAEVAAALADEVAQALAARVDDAVEGVVGDVLVAHRTLERGTQSVAQLRRGDVELSEGERAGGRLLDVDPEVLQEERPEVRLVVVGERDTLVTPAPPLHRTVLNRPCRHCSHGLDLTQGAPGVGLEPTTYRLTADALPLSYPGPIYPGLSAGRGRMHQPCFDLRVAVCAQ